MIRASIRRPVAISMAYVCIAALGVAAWRNVPIEFLPDSRLPQLTIEARWPGGGSSEVVEAFLTSRLEGLVQQLPDVERVLSNSTEASATVQVSFARGTDMNLVRLELSERLNVLRRDLPPAISFNIRQEDPQEFARQRRPFLSYDVTGPYSLEYLYEQVDEIVAKELRQMMGVASVDVTGARRRVLEVVLDETKVNALGLTPQRVAAAIQALERVGQLGVVESNGLLRPLTIRVRPTSGDDVLDAQLLVEPGRLVRLRDVATIHETYAEPTSHFRINGFPAVSMTVTRTPGTNLVAVADAVKARIAELESLLPRGVRLILRDDESVDVREQLNDLKIRALGSAAVIFVVLLVSLRSFSSAGIVFATIAFSILLTLNLVYFAGFSLNVLTLMGMAMGFGLIVDNAIVVLENIFRRGRAGDSAEVAAEEGAREVVIPILAATLTTVVVLIPFVYMQGELAIYYVPLAVVVGFSLLASLFVAFTFIPALACRMLPGKSAAPVTMVSGKAMAGASHRAPGQPLYIRFYSGLVGLTLRFPWTTIIIATACLAGSYYLFDNYVTRDTIWSSNRAQRTTIDVQIRQPRGTDLETTDELVRYFEDRLRQMPEIEDFVSRVSPEYASINITFPEHLANTIVPVATHEQMYAFSLQFGGSDVRVFGPIQTFYGGGGAAPNYTIQVLGYNYEGVREIAEDIARRLRFISRVRDIDTNSTGSFSRDRATEIVAVIDRSRLAMYGMTARDLVSQISAAIRDAQPAGTVRLAGDEMSLQIKLAGNRDMSIRDFESLIVPSPTGVGVRLGDVAHLEERYVLTSIRRENQQYERTIAYEFRGPARLGDAWRDTVVHYTEVPPGYEIVAQRQFTLSAQERRQIWGVLILSIVLVFMVTAAIFESLRQPLCVLFAVPMALVGVFLLFFYIDAQFNREAYIGVIMMGGIVVNNAILLVARFNQLIREYHMPLNEALVQGTLDRARPILMTSATTVIGLLPLVLFSETVNANIWNALAYTLMGGLISSTILTLTVTPALYLVFERRAARRRDARRAMAPTEVVPA